jgi:membrane-associated phospholipid phosphatase
MVVTIHIGWVTASSHNTEELENIGDILQIAIPATAGLISIAHGDDEGAIHLLEGALYTGVATHSLKFAINAKRPNGGDHSFPSGHTSAAAQGAAHLQFRYGYKYGIPAYLLTGVVGYSRVDSEHHYWRDVIAGAALATGIQYGIEKAGISLTNLFIAPFVNEAEAGVYVSLSF